MSELILPENIAKTMPNLRSDREQAQWWEGKATRRELAVQVAHITERIDKEMHSVAKTLSNVYSMARVNGLQLETMVRMLNKGVPDFKKVFNQEFNLTLQYVGFLDTINPRGEHSEKPMKEKIEMVRAWNAREDAVKVIAAHFGLDMYIVEHSDEFTPEEREALKIEFDMDLPEIPPTKTETIMETPDVTP
jgi:hypothetical protein